MLGKENLKQYRHFSQEFDNLSYDERFFLSLFFPFFSICCCFFFDRCIGKVKPLSGEEGCYNRPSVAQSEWYLACKYKIVSTTAKIKSAAETVNKNAYMN